MDQRAKFLEEERMRILHLVENGSLKASEAAELLGKLAKEVNIKTGSVINPTLEMPSPVFENNGGQANQKASGEQIGKATIQPRWFRIRVTDLNSGRGKVTVNLPFGLLDWGLRIGAQFAPEVREFDLQEVARILSETEPPGKIVDVMDEEDGEHVEIYIE